MFKRSVLPLFGGKWWCVTLHLAWKHFHEVKLDSHGGPRKTTERRDVKGHLVPRCCLGKETVAHRTATATEQAKDSLCRSDLADNVLCWKLHALCKWQNTLPVQKISQELVSDFWPAYWERWRVEDMLLSRYFRPLFWLRGKSRQQKCHEGQFFFLKLPQSDAVTQTTQREGASLWRGHPGRRFAAGLQWPRCTVLYKTSPKLS